jgi:rSAM/selenodomain-associated transferase 2
MSTPKLSIIVPVLNEAASFGDALAALAPLRARGAEVIVADGGSTDATVKLARDLADRVVTSPRGRGAQMNAGAAVARSEALLFLHADTRLPADAVALVVDGLADWGRVWGRFDVSIEGRSALLPVIAAMMNLRSSLTGIATGDQAMFMTRDAFARAGGFPDIALMEDIAMSRRLKRLSRPVALSARVRTSGRRWDERGALRTVLMMWRLRLLYFFGVAPEKLAQRYGYMPRKSGE